MNERKITLIIIAGLVILTALGSAKVLFFAAVVGALVLWCFRAPATNTRLQEPLIAMLACGVAVVVSLFLGRH